MVFTGATFLTSFVTGSTGALSVFSGLVGLETFLPQSVSRADNPYSFSKAADFESNFLVLIVLVTGFGGL